MTDQLRPCREIDVDWSAAKYPWNEVVLSFRSDLKAISRGEVPHVHDQRVVRQDLIDALWERHRNGVFWKDMALQLGCDKSTLSAIVNGQQYQSSYVPEIRKWLSSTASRLGQP